MRAGAGVFAACLLCAGQLAWAVEARVGGRMVSLTGHVEGREVIEANRDPPHDRTFAELFLQLRLPWNERFAFQSAIVARHGGPTSKADGGGTYT